MRAVPDRLVDDLPQNLRSADDARDSALRFRGYGRERRFERERLPVVATRERPPLLVQQLQKLALMVLLNADDSRRLRDAQRIGRPLDDF